MGLLQGYLLLAWVLQLRQFARLNEKSVKVRDAFCGMTLEIGFLAFLGWGRKMRIC